MRIEIDEKSGFCFGVVKAIGKAETLLHESDELYCLGDIVHNRVEVNRLEELGLKVADHAMLDSLSGKQLLIRAHGEPPATYRRAAELGIIIQDATCPVVAHLQKTVRHAREKMKQVEGTVVILGKQGHAEVVGLTGQVDEEAIVVEKVEDLDRLDFSRPIYLLSQTTQSLELFQAIGQAISERSVNGDVTIHDTICRQVSNRNPHLREFATGYDVVIFVSGKKSSNGKALYEVCRSANAHCYKVEDELELESEWFSEAQSVGICGATSTPKWLMERVATQIALIDRKKPTHHDSGR